jgi:hypothetical protein
MAKDDLKGLPPEERIKILKKLEEEKKKEIAEAEKAIKESQDELTERRKWADKVPIPQMSKDDFKGMSPDEAKVQESHKGKKSTSDYDVLEDDSEDKDKNSLKEVLTPRVSGESIGLEDLAREHVELPPELMNSQYAMQLSQQPMQNLYHEITGIKQAVEDKGYISAEEEKRVNYLASAVEKKVEAGEDGKYSFTEDVARAANLTRAISANLRGMYKSGGNTGYQN